MLARSVAKSPKVAQARAVVGYRLRKAPHDGARLGWFFLRGHGRWIAKGWTWLTHAHLRADARAAWLAGDSEARRSAQELIRADARARWAKIGIAAHRVTAGVLLAAFLGGMLALINTRVARADMWPWLATVYTVLGVTGAVLTWILKAVPIGWLVAAVWEGRDRNPDAGWLVRPSRDDADSWVDERMISQALAHLGISPLERFFKAGGELVYTVPARLDGDGTYAQIRLPMGVTADMVAAKRTTLAANLGRATLETWPTQGEEAGILELWIADKGKLGGGAGPWPLLHEGTVDVFQGGADREDPARTADLRALLRAQLDRRRPPRPRQNRAGPHPAPGCRPGSHGGIVGVRDCPEHRLQIYAPSELRFSRSAGSQAVSRP
jgi:S-DNA-T family DNA segregation ATPase FtsK/SpoIIIE